MQSDVRESTHGRFKCSVVQNFFFLARIVPARATMVKDFVDFCVTKLGYAVAVDQNPRFCRLISSTAEPLGVKSLCRGTPASTAPFLVMEDDLVTKS